MTPSPRSHDASESSPSVAIIVLNWNSWPDTIECLESLLRLDYPSFHVIVCDNGSTDGSVDRFRQWASGELCVRPSSPHMGTHSIPPVKKPITFNSLSEGGAWLPSSEHLSLIENRANLGFAAGNNAGLMHALERGFEYFWVLNADTVVAPDALTHLVSRIRSVEGAGLCGSLLCYYDAPETIQEAGGCTSYPMLGLSRRLAGEAQRNSPLDWRGLEAKLDYISGAACLVSRDFLETVGPMSEDYFLYCEEIDWATRAKGLFSLVLAEESIVYHKKGMTTGSKAFGRSRSVSSAYYLWRARRRYCQRHKPAALVGLFAVGLATSLLSVLKRDTETAKAIVSGLLNKVPNDSGAG